METSSEFAFQSLEDEKGGFYLVWTHRDGPQSQLLGQHVDAQGHPLWQEPGIPLLNSAQIIDAWNAVADTQGGLVIAWGSSAHVQAQRFGPDAKPLWSESSNEVTISTAAQQFPALAPDGSGGAFIVWQEKSYPLRWVLMAQHINPLGARLWPAVGLRVSLRPSDQRRPNIVTDGQAGAIIAWQDYREKASQLQVQRLDYQGTRIWELEGILVTAPAGRPSQPPYLGDIGSGSAVLAWQASSSAANRILLQLVDPEGELAWDPAGIDVSDGTWDEWNPVLHGDTEGGVWVGWEDYRNAVNWQVFVQHFQEDGLPAWPGGEEVALNSIHADQGHLAFTDDGQKGILAAWIDNRYGTLGVYLQEVNAQGQTLYGPEGYTIADHLTRTQTLHVVSLSPGQVAVSWVDQPAKDQWALYWQTVHSRGTAP